MRIADRWWDRRGSPDGVTKLWEPHVQPLVRSDVWHADAIDRRLEVRHLPGHSPGSIGLWEDATRTLFSGDAIYDGTLLDSPGNGSVTDYVETTKRLRAVPAEIVHGGHEESFGREHGIAIADAYPAARC